MKTKHMTTLHLRNSIGRSPLRLGLPRVQPIWIIRGFLLIALAVTSLALSPMARALYSNTTGINNTATGFGALYSNTGAQNTASGFKALYFSSSGTGNTGEGYRALLNNTGSNNIGLGSNAGINLTTGSSNIDIGNNGVAAETTTIRIGASQTKTF